MPNEVKWAEPITETKQITPNQMQWLREQRMAKPIAVEPTPSPYEMPRVGVGEGREPSVSPYTPSSAQSQWLREQRMVQPAEPEPLEVPFWQRSLQVFAAPFVWVEENVIKPSLAIAGTFGGAVPELKRLPGEDYFEWKKRSWEAWKAPGININVPWSDDPWRVDIKGVMELAPWLLMPGVGQVGGGVRAAAGIAGALGKLGKVGRVAGYALQYSPWGLVEKTAGVALKKSAKAIAGKVGKVSPAVEERLFGKIPEVPTPPIIAKLNSFLKETVLPARKAFEKELPVLRAKQTAAVEAVWKRFRSGEITATEATQLSEKATAGGIKAGFAVKAEQFTAEEAEDLLGQIIKASESGLVTRDSAIAMRDLLIKGSLPEPHHIRDFARVYGEETAKAIGELTHMPRGAANKLLDAANLPRAVLASADLSATFRQGLILLLTRPQDAPRAFWRQLKGFASEKLSLEMDDALRNHSLYKNAIADGVEFTAIKRGAAMGAKEEPFFSNLAQVLPLVRRSERAFTTFLNEMRMGSYEAAYGAMTAQGATAAEMKLMARFINMASGRGTLPANLDRYAPVLNTVLFSARYQMSTLQLPRQIGRMLLSKNPYMRKEAAKALITFVGGGSALLGLLKATGRGEVALDPRSGDFGKIKIGDTRLDIWRGYVQYARFVAQMLTGERKSAYGNMNKAQRSEIATRFLQSKASPALGLFADLLKGENFQGEPIFNDTTGFIKTARDRLLPLAMQDVIDAMEQSGVNGLWTAAPATLGIGVLTYVNDYVRVKERIARELGFKTWDEIDPKRQREIQNRNKELQAATIAFDRQIMGTAWGDWRLAGKAVEEVFRDNVNKAVNQYRETADGYQFREKVSDAFTARRGGYATLEKEPRFEDIVRRLGTKDTAEALVGLGPEQLAIRSYNDALFGDDMYDEFGDYRFEEADERKQLLRTQLGEELFNYVEEYRGLRFEGLPAEFQELTKARKIMKPYWRVKEELTRIYGEPQTPSQENRLNSMISKIRKRMRLGSPELEKYYQLFYARS